MQWLKSLALISTLILITGIVLRNPVQSAGKQQPPPTTVLQSASPSPSPTPTPIPLPPPTVHIDDYRLPAGRIIGTALTSDWAYERLAYLTDRIGNRLSGSKNLERAIEWALAEMKSDGLDNVRAEKVMVPHWVRGAESLEMISPEPRKL
jgi:carboxypeptidase Q